MHRRENGNLVKFCRRSDLAKCMGVAVSIILIGYPDYDGLDRN